MPDVTSSRTMADMSDPEPAAPSVRWQPAIWQGLVHTVVVVILLAVFRSVVPTFARMFEEADLLLPAPSVFVINMSNYLVQRWFIAVPVVLFLLAFDLAVLAALRIVSKAGPILSTLWFLLGLAFLALIVLLTIAGLTMPLSRMETAQHTASTTRSHASTATPMHVALRVARADDDAR